MRRIKIFHITSIDDVKNYINNNEINEIRSDRTIIHELIALQIDHINYNEILSLSGYCIDLLYTNLGER